MSRYIFIKYALLNYFIMFQVRSIFPLQSQIVHSCQPNLQYIEKEGGRKIVLQATTKIEAGDRLSVRYTPFLQGRLSLKKWLLEQRYIECSCARCVDATELGTFTRWGLNNLHHFTLLQVKISCLVLVLLSVIKTPAKTRVASFFP